jgi:hypothetical protein
MLANDYGRNIQAFLLSLVAVACGWGSEVAMWTATRAPVAVAVHAVGEKQAEAAEEDAVPQPLPVDSGGQTAALMIGFAGLIGALGTLLKGWYEHNQRMRLLEQAVVDDRKELVLWRRWSRAVNRDHKVPMPDWAWDWHGEPHSNDSTPPIVAKRAEDTVDLPRAD